MSIANLLTGGVLDFLAKIVDKAIPDPEQKARAQAAIMQATVSGEIQALQAEMQVMLEEARSTDPWTSRARPTFLYVIYLLIVSAIPMGVVYAVSPSTAANVTTGFGAWLGAIPEPMLWLFGAGYMGYAASRTADKISGADKMASMSKK